MWSDPAKLVAFPTSFNETMSNPPVCTNVSSQINDHHNHCGSHVFGVPLEQVFRYNAPRNGTK